MRALFVGGMVDNSEMDMANGAPPLHYPEDTGGGRPRYDLHHVGRSDGDIAIRHGDTVYLSPDENRLHRFGKDGMAL